MRYAKLSCIEFYSCYLQQCLSIGQKGHMNKVCQSFSLEVFLELAHLVFFGTQLGVKGPCGVVHDRARFFENDKLVFVVFIQKFSQEWLIRHK